MSHLPGSTHMDANEIYNLIECVNCGAKLPPVDPTGKRHCQFCDTSYQAAPPAAPQPPPAMQAPPNLGGWSAVNTGQPGMVPTTVTTQSSGGCGVAVLALFVVIMIASVGIPVFFAVKGGSGFSVGPQDKTGETFALAPASLNGGKTLFTTASRYEAGGTKYAMVRLDEGKSDPVWKSADLNSTSLSNPAIVTDGTNVYVADGERVVALRVTDGGLAWQGQLTDELNSNFPFDECQPSCLFLVGERVVANTRDGMLHAFSTKSGEKAWTKKTADTRTFSAAFGDKTLIIDNDAGFKASAILIGPDGSEVSKVSPTCQKTKLSFEAELEEDANVILQPEQNAAIFGFDSPACWVRVDFGTGQQTWNTRVDDSSQPTGRNDTYIVTSGSKAAIVGGGHIAALNLETGEYTPVNEIKDTELYPLGMHENTLVLQTANSRGTKKYAINAVDMTSGEGTWNIDLGKSASPVRGSHSSGSVSSNEARFDGSVEGGTFHAVVFDGSSRQLTTYTVPLATGQQTKNTTDSKIDELIPSFNLQWRGPNAVISFGSGGILVVDTTNATIGYRYP